MQIKDYRLVLFQLYKIIFDAFKYYEYLIHKNDIIIQQRPSRQPKHSFDIVSIKRKHSFHKGHKTYVFLPADELFCILHPKQLDRQVAQNDLYDKIEQTGRTKYKV